ncbi:MAG: hypothetical protein AB1762_14805, partial [Gemmatimonadota bacterium]
MRQSSATEAVTGREIATRLDRRAEREQSILLYVGLAGAVILSSGLWFIRAWIARASALDFVGGALVLLGASAVLCVLTALVILATRVDRASEDVSRALDAVADGKLNVRLDAPRGLGREARLAGAASAALARFRTWVDASHKATITIEDHVAGTRGVLPKLRESIVATQTQVQQLTRDSRYLAGAGDEQGGLTQRACVLASVIGQSNRDTSAFVERIHAAVADAATALGECAARTTELRALVARQQEDTTRGLEADEKLAAFLVAVTKSARQFKLLALHGAMEAARAGAQTEGQGTRDKGQGAEFRVVALEVRRLAMDLASATEEMVRTAEAARRALQTLHDNGSAGTRHVEAAQAAMTLGVAALEHATAATEARRIDDAGLAEAGTELTILTSAIRERAVGSAKGIGDLADRLSLLEQSLGGADLAGRQIDQALAAVEA